MITWKTAPNPCVLLAYVGDVKIGLIQKPVPGNETKNTYFCIALPDIEGEEGWRATEKAARKKVESEIKKWFIRAGRLELISRIKEALNTEEDGEALIEVARNAHRAEMASASKSRQDETQNKTPIAVWSKLRRLMDEHPDAKIVTWFSEDEKHYDGEAQLVNVMYRASDNTIELVFD